MKGDKENMTEKELNENQEEKFEKEQDIVSELQEKLKEEENKYMRLYADFQNFSKRKEKQLQENVEFSTKRILEKVIPIYENLERAINAYDKENKEDDPLYKGVHMTYSSFKALLEAEGVTIIDPIDEIYNPEFHEAVSVTEDENIEHQKIVAVYSKGYLLKGKLIQTAKVQINK